MKCIEFNFIKKQNLGKMPGWKLAIKIGCLYVPAVRGAHILVPRALLTCVRPSATRGSGQIHNRYHKNMVRKQYPVLELANQMPVRQIAGGGLRHLGWLFCSATDICGYIYDSTEIQGRNSIKENWDQLFVIFEPPSPNVHPCPVPGFFDRNRTPQ
jgi:hypothetical protein